MVRTRLSNPKQGIGLAAFATTVTGAIALFLCTGRAADEAKTETSVFDAKSEVETSDPLGSLRRATDQVDGIYEAYLKAADRARQEGIWKNYIQTNDSVVPKIPDGVRQFPDSPSAFGLLEWVVNNNRISTPTLRPYNLQAIERLRNHYTGHTNIRQICRALGFSGDPLNPPTLEFLQIAATKNPDRAARGVATFALAHLMKQKAEDMAFLETAPASILTNAAAQKVRAAFLGHEGQDARAVLLQAEQLFHTVQKNYSDVPNFPSGPGLRQPEPTLGEQASIELYECQHLTVGQVAPEIQGEDVDGRKLTLSDYRGKVVIISFWASWCGPCMQMVPHEQAISQRMVGKPFVLLGVNGDSGKAEAKRAAAKESMTWRSFWNGGTSEGGIAGTWNVHAWPTIYVLDSKGTIRLKHVGYGGKRTDALLDAVVDQLLEEAEVKRRLD